MMYDPESYEYDRDMSPMERMHREEMRQALAVERAIHALHDSLPAKSSDIQLFTFAETKQWNLRKNARRSVPGNNDHEADGA